MIGKTWISINDNNNSNHNIDSTNDNKAHYHIIYHLEIDFPIYKISLWLFGIAMENRLFESMFFDDLPNMVISTATFNKEIRYWLTSELYIWTV